MEDRRKKPEKHEELPLDESDALVRFCHCAIRIAVKVLALLMVVVIFFGIADVLYVLYQRLSTPPVFLLNISDIFETFAAFLAVLIAVEIFVNIRIYLKSTELPVKLVLATALMAVARKAIVLDFTKLEFTEVLSLSAIVLALGITYGWILLHERRSGQAQESERRI